MKKILVLATLIFGVVMVGTHEAGGWTWYNGVNKGIVVGPEGHSCGFEIVGVFGPFCD
jgi:hypothetical protein